MMVLFIFMHDKIGLTEDSVKTMTQPARKLPTWAKAMLYVWKNK